jgi:thiamine biosynthesis lipoprotein
MAVEVVFPAMGSAVNLVVDGDIGLIDVAIGWIEQLERRWTRFRPDSEISRLNDAAGQPVVVSRETADVVALAVEGWSRTGGRFDPTMLRELVAAGYDRTFAELSGACAAHHQLPVRTSSCADVWVDRASRIVQLPCDLSLDLGGIGKGRAADIVARGLIDAGASGVAVSIGGDVRLTGLALDPGGWGVGIDGPDGTPVAMVAVMDGGVATTTSARRHWSTASGDAHHLIDPATGRPSISDVAQVTVIAGDTAWAEVFAKGAFVAGVAEGSALIERAGLCGLLIDLHGSMYRTAGFERYER